MMSLLDQGGNGNATLTTVPPSGGTRHTWAEGQPEVRIDPLETRTVEVILETIAAVTGLSEVGVAVLGERDELQELVVVGPDPGLASSWDPPTSLTGWVATLERATPWGGLVVLMPPEQHVDLPGADDDDQSWKPGERLVCALHGEDDEFLGFVWADHPVDGRRPTARACTALADLARQVGQVLSVAARRRDLAEQVRLVTASRAVLRGAARELEIDAVMRQVCQPLITGLRAVGLWLHVFASQSGRQSTLYTEVTDLARLTPEQELLAARIAQDAWSRQQVGVISGSRLRGGLLSAAEVGEIRTFLSDNGVGSFLLIPIGVGAECLGSLILARKPQDAMWSEPEIDLGLDLGHDLGQALLNARSFQRERVLVEELRATDARRTILMRTMAHEIKSPLTAILANLELLDDSIDTTPESRRSVAGVTRGAQRLLRIVDDLMTLAENGDPDTLMNVGPVDLGALVEEAADLKRTEAQRGGVIINVERTHEPIRVLGDASGLDLVVTNLVSNAVKYSPQGSTVTLGLTRTGDRIIFTCTDEGIGISSNEVDHIFDEFFRSADPQARAKPGTGLGLAIVDRIIRRHHGTIQVDSLPGRGTTFQIDLPGCTDEASAEPQRALTIAELA